MSKLGFVNPTDILIINRKRRLREFRKAFGNLDKEFDKEARQAEQKDLQEQLKNPQEILNMKNVREMEAQLDQPWDNRRRFVDEYGTADDLLYAAPKNDLQSIKTANTNALEFVNQLTPDPALQEARTQTQLLKDLQEKRKKKNRLLKKLRNF
jgi:Sec-independent protein translocase protein TatA